MSNLHIYNIKKDSKHMFTGGIHPQARNVVRKGNDMSDVIARGTQRGDVAAFLNEVKAEHAVSARGRLIFGLDATASRKETWDRAAALQAEMFRATAAIGKLDLQLVYYRGDRECRASKWISDPAQLARIMSTIDCRAGETQIEKVLAFIGDAVEENPDILVARARELGRLKVPAFLFQEGDDSAVQTTFCDIARNTGGAYGRFDSGSAKQLAELLKAAALFAVGGAKALEGRKDAGSVLLLDQLKGGA
jgi:hypothetical protein